MQTYLAIGAIILFTLLILNVNNMVISNQDVQVNSEAYSGAASVADAMTNEINAKAFDKSTINNTVLDMNTLTLPSALGPEAGEVYPAFNDIDDFNNYTRNDTTPRLGVYKIKVNVNYVDDANATSIINAKSRTKLITVCVFNASMPDTFKLFSYRSY